MTTRVKRGLQLSGIAIVLCAIVLLYVAINLTTVRSASAMMTGPSATELEDALIRAGLDPVSLTAAGLSNVQAETVVENVRAYMTNNPGELSSASSNYATRKREVDRLSRIVRASTSTSQQRTDLVSARTSLASATTSLAGALDGIVDAGTATLSQGLVDNLTNLRANRGWSADTEFKVVNRSEADWVTLRAALANERIAGEQGESVDQDASSLLSTERGLIAVSMAKSNLDANLAVVTSSWETTIAGE